MADFDTFVSTSSDSLFTADIGTRVNLPNVVDYFLFINVIGADDNDAKNQYFSFYSSKSNPQFFYSVWDMDGSMGRTWDGIYDSDTQVYGTTNYLFSRLIALNVGGFRDMMKARWNSLKTNQLSKNTVNLRILAFAKQLILTNAGSREMVKWGNITQSFTAEATYMSNWYSAHYDNLDNYINGKL